MNYQKEFSLKLSKLSESLKKYIKTTTAEITDAYKTAESEKNIVSAVFKSAYILILKLKPLLYFTAAFILSGSRITLGIYPMGQAFLSASGRHMLYAYVGALTSAIFSSGTPLIDIAVYTLTICLRRLTAIFLESGRRFTDFEDNLRIKMAVSMIGAVVLGAFNAIKSGFSFRSLAAFLLYVAITPALTFLYSAVVSNQKNDATILYREASGGALAVSLVIAVREFSFLSFNLAVMSALILTVAVTRRYGLPKGVLFGLFMGLSVSAELMPVFSIAAVTAGVLFSASAYLSVTAATMASVSWTIYAGGYMTAATTAPSLFFGGAVLLLLHYGGMISPSVTKDENDIPHEALIRAEKLRRDETNELLSSEAAAFSGLSDMLFRLSDKLRRPSYYDVKEVAAKGRREICKHCKSKDVCYSERESDAADAWAKVTSRLFNNGVLVEDDIPDFLNENCGHTLELTDSINESYADMLRSLIDTDKTEIMAFDYSAISSVLSDVMVQRQNEYEINDALSKKFAVKLRENKITAKRVCVFGDRRKTVYISNIKLSGLHIGEDDLRKLANEACSGEFSSPEFELKGGEVNATLHSVESFSVRFEKRQITKDESSACGDVAIGFPCRDDRHCVLISDGMGSGREAALTSGMCALFIEKMISAGNSAAVTLKMLNAMIRAKGAECSATIDLLDLDLLTGQARFIKSGAAPSFIVRGNEVYKIDSKTLPVGIIRSLDAEQTTVRVKTDDIIVMVSDGIIEGDEDSAWLYSLLSDVNDSRVTDIADAIITEAERRLRKKDDATVCVIRVASPLRVDESIF